LRRVSDSYVSDVSHIRRLRELEDGNRKSMLTVADLSLDNRAIKDELNIKR